MHPAKVRPLVVAGAVMTVVMGGTAGVSGNGSASPMVPTTVEILDWSLPTEGDFRPGAVVVDVTGDGNRLWFVTRDGSRVYRMDFRGGKKVNKAQWLSIQLNPMATGVANGLRRVKTSGDKRQVFVDSTVSLQRIDTGKCKTTYAPTASFTCPRTTWVYQDTTPPDASAIHPLHGSDVAIDEYNNHVYTAVAVVDDAGFPIASGSFIQRLDPNSDSYNVKRWYVGHNAGNCPTSLESPCLSGIAIDRRNRDLVYYSEPGNDPMSGEPEDSGSIAELNTRYGTVRRWRMADLGANTADPTIREPRQLYYDNDGTLWAITGSGHLVSLDPKKSKMSKHTMPPEAIADPFGVGPDGGLIGYTDPGQVQPRVGMLMPNRKTVFVPAMKDGVESRTFTIPGQTENADTAAGEIGPEPHIVPVRIIRDNGNTFSEALTSGFAQQPLGITPDQSARTGTYFFAIGDFGMMNRIARVRLPRNEMRGRFERDDDDHDDDGKRHGDDDDDDGDGNKDAYDADSDNDGSVDTMDNDDDEDGITDDFDTKDKKEYQQTNQQDVAAGQAGEDLFTLNPSTLLVVASATVQDPLSSVKVEIVDAAGNVVASSLATPGAAAVTFVPPAAGGNYTLRAKNLGISSQPISTKILTRELWPIAPIGL